MYPATLYGHIVTTAEIMVGLFLIAVIAGPDPCSVFPSNGADFVVIAVCNGQPTLMLRVANLRHHSMVEGEFWLMLHRTTRPRRVKQFGASTLLSAF